MGKDCCPSNHWKSFILWIWEFKRFGNNRYCWGIHRTRKLQRVCGCFFCGLDYVFWTFNHFFIILVDNSGPHLLHSSTVMKKKIFTFHSHFFFFRTSYEFLSTYSRNMFLLNLVLFTHHTWIAFVFSIVCMILRHHLFVWSVFSPKFIYLLLDSIFQLFLTFVLLIFSLFHLKKIFIT